MKVVIDIDEEEYAKAKCKGLIKSYKVVDAFRDATPLEKVLEDIRVEIKNSEIGCEQQTKNGMEYALKIMEKYMDRK